MDLSKFTKKETKIITEIILDNDEIKIIKQNDEIEFLFKSKKSLLEYEKFLFASPSQITLTDNINKANLFFEKSLADGVEGLMFKAVNQKYKPGLRTGAMAKLKETKEDIDVVITRAEYGKGKRAGFYSSFYIAIRDPNAVDIEEEFLEIGKVSSGIKELSDQGASLKNLSELLEPLKIKEEKSISYFKPKIILQVRYQEIQKSTTYSSGYALRFPRIIFLRDDKDITEINTIYDIKNFK